MLSDINKIFSIKEKNKMKNRKTIVVAFMLVAVLMLGVGYAALTTHLNIDGGATVSVEGAQNSYADDIKFTKVSTDASMYTASIGDGKTADFTVTGLKGATDTVTITYDITNSGDLDSIVKIDTGYPTNDKDAFFDVEISEPVNGGDYETAGVALGAGKTIQISVKITLKQTPTNTDAPTVGNFYVRLISTTTEDTSGTNP